MGVSIWEGGKADRLILAVEQLGGQYNTTSAASIVAAIRGGNIDKIPDGSVFTEHHDVYGDIKFVTRAKNMHKVAGDPTRSNITIQPLYLLSANGGTSAATFQYDRPEAFTKVKEAIPAGSVCKFTTIAYGGWLAGDWHFTADAAIDAGKMLCINGYQSAALETLKVQVFDTPKATSPSAQYNIVSGDGDATVNLGTWGTDCNHPQRVSCGSNNEAQSNFLQFLNADTGNSTMDTVFEQKTEYDMMSSQFTSLKGFLGGFSDEFRSYLGLCAIPNIANSVFEDSPYVVNTKYTHNGYFFLPSRKEIYGSNENANEDSETQFGYYQDIATSDADKLMFAENAASPTAYWLRTPYAGHASSVRLCYTGYGGALSSNSANGSYGAAPLAILA